MVITSFYLFVGIYSWHYQRKDCFGVPLHNLFSLMPTIFFLFYAYYVTIPQINMENVVSLCSVFTPKRQLTRPENCNSPVMGYYYGPHNTLYGKCCYCFFLLSICYCLHFYYEWNNLKSNYCCYCLPKIRIIHLDSNSIEKIICKNQVFLYTKKEWPAHYNQSFS